MKYVKLFEEFRYIWTEPNHGFEIETINIEELYKNAPNEYFKNSYKNYIIENLKFLIGKYISFVSLYEDEDRTRRHLNNGVVEDINFHIRSKTPTKLSNNYNIVYIKLSGENQYLPVDYLDPVININLTKTAELKYNL